MIPKMVMLMLLLSSVLLDAAPAIHVPSPPRNNELTAASPRRVPHQVAPLKMEPLKPRLGFFEHANIKDGNLSLLRGSGLFGENESSKMPFFYIPRSF